MPDLKTNHEKNVLKRLIFCGFGTDGNLPETDVTDGKMVQTRPFHHDRKYKMISNLS